MQRGFALINLLIVLVILGILLFLVPFPHGEQPQCLNGPCPIIWQLGDSLFKQLFVNRTSIVSDMHKREIVFLSPSDETAGWKIYATEEFSFKYPPEWTVEKTDNIKNPDIRNYLTLKDSAEKTRITVWIVKGPTTPTCVSLEANENCEFFPIQGKEAVINWVNYGYAETMIPLSDKEVIIVNYVYESPDQLPQVKIVLRKFFSTFTFLDAAEGKPCGFLPIPDSGDDPNCPAGYICTGLDPGNDAGGKCKKE